MQRNLFDTQEQGCYFQTFSIFDNRMRIKRLLIDNRIFIQHAGSKQLSSAIAHGSPHVLASRTHPRPTVHSTQVTSLQRMIETAGVECQLSSYCPTEWRDRGWTEEGSSTVVTALWRLDSGSGDRGSWEVLQQLSSVTLRIMPPRQQHPQKSHLQTLLPQTIKKRRIIQQTFTTLLHFSHTTSSWTQCPCLGLCSH